MLLSFAPALSYAESVPASVPANKTVEAARAKTLLSRLEEIKALDRSEMSFTEKRALRKEVRSIKSELTVLGGGVYLSVGGIIIILLILILIL